MAMERKCLSRGYQGEMKTWLGNHNLPQLICVILLLAYIIPGIVGAPGYFIGQMVYVQQGTAGNIPLAAAFSVVPIVLISIYLALAKRMGAFDAL